MSSYIVRHTHGTSESFSSLDDAMASLAEIYGDDIETEGDLDEGRVLVWQDAESSVDDDGARAVASISQSR